MWQIRCYRPTGDSGGFRSWYDTLIEAVQAEIDAVLELLETSRPPWPETLYAPLHGSCEGLVEIRIEFLSEGDDSNDSDDEGEEPEQYRILAFEGPDQRELTVLYGFKKTTNADYGPACRAALNRRDGVKKDVRRAPFWNYR